MCKGMTVFVSAGHIEHRQKQGMIIEEVHDFHFRSCGAMQPMSKTYFSDLNTLKESPLV